MISTEIIQDSLAPSGARLTTFLVTYPRFIHSEFMTHRAFSRNASSSRAIPVSKNIKAVVDSPAIPIEFTKNKKGMQGGDPLENQEEVQKVWLEARDAAVKYAQLLESKGVHKQFANRIIEPYSHITVVISATDFDNFFALRTHKDAQPEIQALARKMYKTYKTSIPVALRAGDWHLPFITVQDIFETTLALGYLSDMQHIQRELAKRSAAKCARTSYLTHDGTVSTREADLVLYERLAGSMPIHASPLEHQAMAVDDPALTSGNFRGFVQHRKLIEGECVEDFESYLSVLTEEQKREYELDK